MTLRKHAQKLISSTKFFFKWAKKTTKIYLKKYCIRIEKEKTKINLYKFAKIFFEFKKIKTFFLHCANTRKNYLAPQNRLMGKSKKKPLEVVDAQVSVTTMIQIV